ncbi:hypothetical protein G9A89_023647 [Geosiphon pyriformis]|nr:hypothetical protein G9A89_023647 [Geosiphon pyriformis]
MASAKAEGATTSELLEIKNNSLSLFEPEYVQTFDVFSNIEDNPEEFYEYYQQLAPTKEEQEQHLEQLHTQLCQHCLIPCDFQYCNKCNLIYNLPICMIYTIPEEKKPISSYASELESIFNSDSNSDNNDDKNNGSNSTQYGNENNNNLDSNLNPKRYIVLPDLTKEQKLKWFSDNNKGIMLEHAHNTDAEFDLRYPGKDLIKLKPHLHTCINLKIVLEILAIIMVQLASRSSLAKKRINIREGIIDAEYIKNIIVYIIDPNEKIAQTIFLPLVKITQLVLVGNREELGITAKGIQRFRSTGKIDIPVNIMKEEIIDKEKIISTRQLISIPPYDQYMLAIKREVKNQAQLFETEATICKSEKIGFTNLYILAKSPKNIKIPIYNTTKSVIEIPKRTIIEYLTTKVENQPPNHIPDFLQLCRYVDITSQTIYRQSKYYLLQPEQLEQINMGNLDPL